jgi:Tfp pilus assembly protein PilF
VELSRVLTLDPRFQQAKFYLADSYVDLDRYDEAEHLLVSVLNDDPKNVRTRIVYARMLEKLKRSTEAVQEFQIAIEQEPKRADAHYQLAQLYKKLGKDADAGRQFKLARQLHVESLKNAETLISVSGNIKDSSIAFAPSRPTQPDVQHH